MRPFLTFRALGWSALLFSTACGSSSALVDTVADEAPLDQPATWSGTVRYASRQATTTGASRETFMRPARQVPVSVLDADGEVLATTRTDDEGAFTINSVTAAVRLEVTSHIDIEGIDLAVTRDPGGETDHVFGGTLPEPGTPVEVEITDDFPEAGAFHILDAMLLGSRSVHEWTGRRLPPFFCYWGRGVTVSWSFYTGERGQTGRYTIELLGGEPGRQHLTDTDEHDESIILHEFGHFVMDQLSTNSSFGGSHPRGFLFNPGLAYEEARATWFASMVLRDPLYLDTIGIEPSGELRVRHDLERGEQGSVRGLGSEGGTAEILWDLADGEGDELSDVDRDGVHLGAATMLEAMAEMREREDAFPAIDGFLRFLVETGRVEPEAVDNLLARGGHPRTLLPENDNLVWPPRLALGRTVSGKIDGVSNPAPSGGPPRPSNGQDAMDVFRIHVPESGRLTVELTIQGSGSAQDRTNLDLELRDIRAEALGQSTGMTPQHIISRELEAGQYVIYVRDGGEGNRADYELRAMLR